MTSLFSPIGDGWLTFWRLLQHRASHMVLFRVHPVPLLVLGTLTEGEGLVQLVQF